MTWGLVLPARSSSGGPVGSPNATSGRPSAYPSSSDYDVYEKPASQCQPPTARPGQPMHEQGLAIDFTRNVALISSRNAADIFAGPRSTTFDVPA